MHTHAHPMINTHAHRLSGFLFEDRTSGFLFAAFRHARMPARLHAPYWKQGVACIQHRSVAHVTSIGLHNSFLGRFAFNVS